MKTTLMTLALSLLSTLAFADSAMICQVKISSVTDVTTMSPNAQLKSSLTKTVVGKIKMIEFDGEYAERSVKMIIHSDDNKVLVPIVVNAAAANAPVIPFYGHYKGNLVNGTLSHCGGL